MGLFQILVFSLIWMFICKYHRDDTSKSSDEFVVQFIITFIICLIPINAVYSVTLSSNILFSYSLMFLGFLIKVMLDRNGQIDEKIIILMALTIAVMSGLNNYGIIIAVPTLIIIAYYLLKKGNSENTMVMFLGLAVLGVFLIGSLNFVYDVDSDYLKLQSDDGFENEINLKLAQNEFFSAANVQPSEGYETINSANLGTSKFNMVNGFVNFWKGNFILDSLFCNPILYMILSIGLLGLIYVRTEAEEIFMIYVPTFLNTVISILTGQDNLYSNLLIFYLVLIVCMGIYFKSNLKLTDLSNRAPLRSQPQRMEAQPMYQVQEPQDDSYYSYLESEIDELTLDDINEMLRETPQEEAPRKEAPRREEPPKKEAPRREEPQKAVPPQEEPEINEEYDLDADLIDEILKEMGKK
jgi:hypothetical protein